jgi:uncharacterized protein
MAQKGDLTVQEAGRRGGTSTKKKYGGDFYKAIGKMGGETTKERHGHEHYEKIGKMGGSKVSQLVKLAKKVNAAAKKKA